MHGKPEVRLLVKNTTRFPVYSSLPPNFNPTRARSLVHIFVVLRSVLTRYRMLPKNVFFDTYTSFVALVVVPIYLLTRALYINNYVRTYLGGNVINDSKTRRCI